MKKKLAYRILALALCSSLIVGSAVGCSFPKKINTQETLTKILEEEVKASSSRHLSNSQNSKEETVYVFTDATGKQTKLTVNERLTSALSQGGIEDVSTLSNISNLTGDESFTSGSDNTITWDNNGESITYQGTSDAQVPIETKITYTLDGNEIAPENLAGKSGHVTIRFDFTNHETKNVTIGNKEKELCVPFTVVTGMVLPSDKFWNIEVTNGKVSEVRNDSLVMGITMPGLQKSLNLELEDESLDLNIPDYFEISADTENFEIESIMSIATSSLLTDLDLSSISTDRLTDQMDELQNAANDITDGTVDLQDGTNKLSDGATKLKDGIALLTGKVPELKEGVKKLDSGAGELVAGADKLATGTGDLSKGASSASAGANKLSEGASKLNDGASSLSEGASKLSEGASTLSEGANQVNEGAGSLNEGVTSYTNGVDQIADGAKALNDNMKAYASGMQQFYDALANSDTPLDDGIAALLSGANQINGGSQQLKSQLEGGMSQASAQYNEAYNGFFQIACGFVATANQIPVENAVAVLENNGLSATANVTDANQMAKATGFLMENYSNIQALQLADQTTMVTIVSGLSQSYQAYSLTSGTLSQLTDAGYFDGINSLAGGIGSLSDKIGSFDEEKDGTICTTIAKLNSSASQLQTQGTAPLKDGLKTVADNSSALRDGASKLAEGTQSLSSGASDLATGASDLSTGANTLSAGVSDLYKGTKDLSSGLSTLADGANQVNNGVGQLRNGLNTLKDGTSKLNSGADSLASGTNELMDGAASLADGALSLNSGAITLKDGMIKFNSEGINKLSNLVGTDATETMDTFKAVIELGKEYQSFAGKKDNVDGSVVFIYKIDGITK